MKKIIRTAIVLALAGAALLSTGCTKDVSNDITKIENRTATLEQAVSALQAFQTSAQAAIDKNTNDLKTVQKAVDDLDKDIDLLAAATDAEIEALAEEIEGEVNAIYEDITAIEGEIAELKAAKDNASAALVALQKQVDAIAGRIVSIVAYPMTAPEIQTIELQDVDTVKVFVAGFEISPSKAASIISADNSKILFREGLAKAAISENADIEILSCDPEAGKVVVKTIAPEAALADPVNDKLYFSLFFEGKDAADSLYEVQSQYVVAAESAVTDPYAISIDDEDPVDSDFTVNDTVVVAYNEIAPKSPIYEGIEFKVKIGEDYYSLADAASYLGLASAPKVKVGPAATDTTFTTGSVASPAPSPLPASPFTTDSLNFNGNILYNQGTIATADLIDQFATVHAEFYVGSVNIGRINRTVIIDKAADPAAPDMLAAQTATWNYVDYTYVNATFADIALPAKYVGPTISEQLYVKADGETPLNDAAGTTPTIGGTATAPKLSLAVAGTDLKFDAEAYDCSFAAQFEDDTTYYAFMVPFTVDARPADKTVALADSTAQFLSTGVTVNFKPMTTAITAADTTKYFGKLTGAARDINAIYANMALSGVLTKKSIKDNGDSISIANFSVIPAFDATTKKETSKIMLPNAVPGHEYDIVFTIKAFGVTFTFNQKITVDELPYNLTTDPLFVNDDMEVLTKGTMTGGVYALNDHDLANYFALDGQIPADENNVKINYKFYNEGDSTGVNATAGINALPTAPAQATVPASSEVLPTAPFSWSSFSANKLHASAWLSVGGTRVSDSIAIKIISAQPVTDFVGGSLEATRTTGNDLEINLWKQMSAKGCLADTNIILQNAATLAAAIAGNVNYGQGLEAIDFTQATAVLEDGTPYVMNPAFFSVTSGVLKIAKECGIFTQPVIITIPVKLDYLLDYQHKQALTSNVIVKVTQL